MRTRPNGFSLIELLLVLAIIGIISGIAIPTYLGQRRRARVIGDAQTNARSLAMMLESRKAEAGLYGASGTTQTWTAAGATPSASVSLAPAFTPKGNSQMNYTVAIGNGGLGFLITVKDAKVATLPNVVTLTQTGSIAVASGYR